MSACPPIWWSCFVFMAKVGTECGAEPLQVIILRIFIWFFFVLGSHSMFYALSAYHLLKHWNGSLRSWLASGSFFVLFLGGVGLSICESALFCHFRPYRCSRCPSWIGFRGAKPSCCQPTINLVTNLRDGLPGHEFGDSSLPAWPSWASNVASESSIRVIHFIPPPPSSLLLAFHILCLAYLQSKKWSRWRLVPFLLVCGVGSSEVCQSGTCFLFRISSFGLQGAKLPVDSLESTFQYTWVMVCMTGNLVILIIVFFTHCALNRVSFFWSDSG